MLGSQYKLKMALRFSYHEQLSAKHWIKRERAMIRKTAGSILLLMFAVMLAGSSHAQNPQASKVAEQNQSSDETSQLKRRVHQLEERLVDLQSMIGTVESMAKQGATPSAAPNSPSATAGRPPDISSFSFNTQPGRGSDVSEIEDRISGVETQIRALAGQLGQLNEQIQRMEARLGNSPGPGVEPFSTPNTVPQRFNEQTDPSRREGQSNTTFANRPERANGFGSTVVTEGIPSNTDRPTEELWPQSRSQTPAGNSNVQIATTNQSDPKALYEQGYGQLLARNYAGAETSFTNFLASFPSDKLAGNAQYWLGESFYVRGKYRQAADSFLKGYTKYEKSPKAPDSLLKLAMSLKKLGQKDAACTTFLELNAKYPGAPEHVKLRAETEMRLTGC
jgi:tol-pal system protein YbgF